MFILVEIVEGQAMYYVCEGLLAPRLSIKREDAKIFKSKKEAEKNKPSVDFHIENL